MSERPNILLITTDQHRGDHLSIAGHPVVETPNLDAFINGGAYFPNAYIELLGKRGDGFSDGKQLLPRTDWWSAIVK